MKELADGVWHLKCLPGLPWAVNAFMASPSSAASPSRSSLAIASATGGSAATTELTASAARPS